MTDKVLKTLATLKEMQDDTALRTMYIIKQYPADFLPDLFKTSIVLLAEKRKTTIKINVNLKDLKDGKHHSATSKSDDGIASGLKTLITNSNDLKHLADYPNVLTYMVENHRLVFNIIMQLGLEKKHSISTIKSNINILMRIMFISYGKKPVIYAKYGMLMKALGEKQIAEDNNNSLNKNEEKRYIDFKTVLKEQARLNKEFNDITDKNTKEAYNLNLNLVLLSLYSLNAPLRKELMALTFNEDPYDDKTTDYILFKSTGETILSLHKDKKRHGEIDIILNDDLSNILKQSYKQYQRTYVFTNASLYPDYSKTITIDTVADRLRRIFLKYKVNVGASILRASYFSYIYDGAKGKLSNKDIDDIAVLMRTSRQYLMSSYRKIIDDNDIEEIPEPSPELQPEKEQVIVKPVDAYIKNNEYLKKKYADNQEYRDKVLSQQRERKELIGKDAVRKIKLLSMLRNSPAYRASVKQTTLDKFNIDISTIEIKK